MRVLHVDTGREWRGGQVQLSFLAPSVGVGVVHPPGAPLAEHLPPGVSRHPVDLHRPGASLRLARIARTARADLLAAHTSRAHGLAVATGWPTVVHRRVDFRPRAASWWKYARASHYVAVSRAVAGVLTEAGVPCERITVVPDGVRLGGVPAAVDPGLPRPWVLAVGALVAHKGHAVLVDALRHLPGVTVVIAGEGPLAESLRRRADRAGVADRLRLVGWLPDVAAWVRSADAVVHPSVEEGLGQSVLEALWLGARVVATTAGGLPEAVGGDGILVPPGDPVALARALRHVLEQGGRPDPANVRSRLRRRFSVDAMVRGTRAAYAAALWSTSPWFGDTRRPPPC